MDKQANFFSNAKKYIDNTVKSMKMSTDRLVASMKEATSYFNKMFKKDLDKWFTLNRKKMDLEEKKIKFEKKVDVIQDRKKVEKLYLNRRKFELNTLKLKEEGQEEIIDKEKELREKIQYSLNKDKNKYELKLFRLRVKFEKARQKTAIKFEKIKQKLITKFDKKRLEELNKSVKETTDKVMDDMEKRAEKINKKQEKSLQKRLDSIFESFEGFLIGMMGRDTLDVKEKIQDEADSVVEYLREISNQSNKEIAEMYKSVMIDIKEGLKSEFGSWMFSRDEIMESLKAVHDAGVRSDKELIKELGEIAVVFRKITGYEMSKEDVTRLWKAIDSGIMNKELMLDLVSKIKTLQKAGFDIQTETINKILENMDTLLLASEGDRVKFKKLMEQTTYSFAVMGTNFVEELDDVVMSAVKSPDSATFLQENEDFIKFLNIVGMRYDRFYDLIRKGDVTKAVGELGEVIDRRIKEEGSLTKFRAYLKHAGIDEKYIDMLGTTGVKKLLKSYNELSMVQMSRNWNKDWKEFLKDVRMGLGQRMENRLSNNKLIAWIVDKLESWDLSFKDIIYWLGIGGSALSALSKLTGVDLADKIVKGIKFVFKPLGSLLKVTKLGVRSILTGMGSILKAIIFKPASKLGNIPNLVKSVPLATVAKAVGWVGIAAGVFSAGKSFYEAYKEKDKEKKKEKIIAGTTKLGLVGSGAALGATIGSIIPGIGTALGAVVGGGIGGIIALFKGDTISKWITNVYKEAKEKFKKLFGFLKENVLGTILKTVKWNIDILTDRFKKMKDIWKNVKEGTKNWFKDKFNKIKDWFKREPKEKKDNVKIHGSYRFGLDVVPYDGFVAKVHKGEAILTKEEAEVWRKNRKIVKLLAEEEKAEKLNKKDSFISILESMKLSYSKKEFLKRIAKGIKVIRDRYKLMPSVSMAMAILESSWGKRAPGNNLYGLKWPSSKKKQEELLARGITKQEFWTHEYERGRRTRRKLAFRKYKSMTDSVLDYGRLLGTWDNYKNARNRRNYVEALRGITEAPLKYATDPYYFSKVKKIIEENKLYLFDKINNFGEIPEADVVNKEVINEKVLARDEKKEVQPVYDSSLEDFIFESDKGYDREIEVLIRDRLLGKDDGSKEIVKTLIWMTRRLEKAASGGNNTTNNSNVDNRKTYITNYNLAGRGRRRGLVEDLLRG